MDGVLCPVVVGRSAELSTLTDLVTAAAGGRGGLAVLVGEAGVGKSRLAREAAALATGPRPSRALGPGRAGGVSAALPPAQRGDCWSRAAGSRFRTSPELAGFGAQLARLVPDQRARATRAVVPTTPPCSSAKRWSACSGCSAVPQGCLLVLEDLHWADPETLAVVDYLADTLAAERVLCLATTRSAGPSHAADVLDRLRSRRVGTVLPLAPLSGR